MISSSIGTAYVEDEKDRTYLQTLYANWGTVLTMALVVVWGGIYVFLFLVVHVTYEQTNTFVGIVVPFLVLLGMLLWSFFLTSLTSPRPIPLQYKLTDVEWEAFERLVESPSTQEEFVSRLVSERQLFMMGPNRQINVCRSCRQLKPDRTHHCRRCKMCVMRMDHHCPWFNNCIHFHNYHSFFCTLFYTGLTFAYVVVTVLLFYTIKFKWQLSSLAYYEPVLILVAVSTLCCLMVMSFFFYHMYLSAKNRTHIENLSSDQKQLYDLGSNCKNFKAVHGPWYLWWFPVSFPEHDGCSYVHAPSGPPKDTEMISEIYGGRPPNAPRNRQERNFKKNAQLHPQKLVQDAGPSPV